MRAEAYVIGNTSQGTRGFWTYNTSFEAVGSTDGAFYQGNLIITCTFENYVSGTMTIRYLNMNDTYGTSNPEYAFNYAQEVYGKASINTVATGYDGTTVGVSNYYRDYVLTLTECQAFTLIVSALTSNRLFKWELASPGLTVSNANSSATLTKTTDGDIYNDIETLLTQIKNNTSGSVYNTVLSQINSNLEDISDKLDDIIDLLGDIESNTATDSTNYITIHNTIDNSTTILRTQIPQYQNNLNTLMTDGRSLTSTEYLSEKNSLNKITQLHNELISTVFANDNVLATIIPVLMLAILVIALVKGA